MIRIAEVEDNEQDYQNFTSCLNRYEKENGGDLGINSTWFKSSESFFKSFKKDAYDIIFMDIDLGTSNGMDVSRKIREVDDKTIIIFVSNLAKYAIQGYEVEAMDFIVKPMTYYVFAMKFKKALEKLKKDKEILIPFVINYGKSYIKASTIEYIEIIGHKIIIHTTEGDQVTYGSLKNVEKTLEDYGIDYFGRCNNYLLVNFNYINGIFGLQIKVAGKMLDISHPKKVKFMQEFNKFLGRGGL